MIPELVLIGALGAFLLLGWVLLVIWVWDRVEHNLATHESPVESDRALEYAERDQ